MPLLDDDTDKQSQLFANPLGTMRGYLQSYVLDPLDRAAAGVNANRVEAERYLSSPDPNVRAYGEQMMRLDPGRIAQGFAGPGAIRAVGGAAQGLGQMGIQALRDLQQRIISGVENISGEAKYDILKQIAAKLRELEGGNVPGAGANMIPEDVAKMRATMERINELRQNPMKFK